MNDYLKEEERNGYSQLNLKEQAEKIKQKAEEMEEQVTENLNNFMSVTAENLDKAAEKIHDTAEFFRKRNATVLKEDFSHVVKKKPVHALGGALLIGLLIGKILFR